MKIYEDEVLPFPSELTDAQEMLWCLLEWFIYENSKPIVKEHFIRESLVRRRHFYRLGIGRLMFESQVKSLAVHLHLKSMRLEHGRVSGEEDSQAPAEGNVIVFVKGIRPDLKVILGVVRFSSKKKKKQNKKKFRLKIPTQYNLMLLNESQAGDPNHTNNLSAQSKISYKKNRLKMTTTKHKIFFALFDKCADYTKPKPIAHVKLTKKKLHLKCLVKERDKGARCSQTVARERQKVKHYFVRHVQLVFKNSKLDEGCPNDTKLNLVILEEPNHFLTKFAMGETLFVDWSFYPAQFKLYLLKPRDPVVLPNQFNLLRFVLFEFLTVILILRKYGELGILSSTIKSFDRYFKYLMAPNYYFLEGFELIERLHKFFNEMMKTLESGSDFETAFTSYLQEINGTLKSKYGSELSNFLDMIINQRANEERKPFAEMANQLRVMYSDNQQIDFFLFV